MGQSRAKTGFTQRFRIKQLIEINNKYRYLTLYMQSTAMMAVK
jgi:hypothetical protein